MRGTQYGQPAITPQNGIIPAYAGNTCENYPLAPILPGIIPAYAGNTRVTAVRWSILRDHPRICGEHVLCLIGRYMTPGSSPHMRGTPRKAAHWDNQSGIIPAYAGNTVSCGGKRLVSGDHPRICGEHIMAFRLAVPSLGSSPHMRGTPWRNVVALRDPGIIPAYAGNTLRDYSNFVVSKFMSFVFHLV